MADARVSEQELMLMTTRMRSRPWSRRWLAATLVLLAVMVTIGVVAWPTVVRTIAIGRIAAVSHRPVEMDEVRLNPFTGRLSLRGLRVKDRDRQSPFVDLASLEARVGLLPLLGGHLHIRELTLGGSTVHIVRFPGGFNVSDLLEGSNDGGTRLDVTVDRFKVENGTVTLEDRALPEPRTWISEHIEIDAQHLSTRRNDGAAVARSVTVGAPVSIEIKNMRLYPIHLDATLTTTDLDLSLAQLYLPPDAAIVIQRGRASSTVQVALDARGGVRANATAEVGDFALARKGQRDPDVVVPTLGIRLADFAFAGEQLRVGRLEVSGSAN